MNDRIREAFGSVHAEEGLKTQTKEFIARKAKAHSKRQQRILPQSRMAVAMACFMLLLACFGGYRLYFVRTSVISIDINPSIELNINRYGKVISWEGYNDDGLELADDLHIRFMDYVRAIDEILKTEKITAYMNGNEELSISVVGRNEQESREILANVETSTSGHHNVCCYMGHHEDVNAAHAAGLSVGKYRAFLEVQEVNPDITVEDIGKMTMRQIKDLMDGQTDDWECPYGEDGMEGNGSGHGHRHRHGQERSLGAGSGTD